MDRNTGIGMALILGLFFFWVKLNAPSEAEIKLQKHKQDSIKLVQAKVDSLKKLGAPAEILDTTKNTVLSSSTIDTTDTPVVLDSLSNDLLTVKFSNKGGRINSVLVKKYFKQKEVEDGKVIKSPLYLLEDQKNQFDYIFAKQSGGDIHTQGLVFNTQKSNEEIIFSYKTSEGVLIKLKYKLLPNSYTLKHEVEVEGMDKLNSEKIGKLHWINYLDKLEVNDKYERNYTSVYYKEIDEQPTYCSCTSNDEQDLTNKPVKWVSHANQFFNSALIAEDQFKSAKLATEMLDASSEDLKKCTSDLEFNLGSSKYAMDFYIGPNEFERLKGMQIGLEDVVSYGSSIFGTINRYPIRWIYLFFAGFIANKGIIILCMTLLVKILLIYLTFKMIYSQSKMAALKPEIEKLKAKYGDDPQAMQAQSMKIYGEYGVNPLGGCLPMLLQMPIWIALTRYFSASIEFRQEHFLWATDLTSYDVFMRLPFTIPFYGDHVSMFTLLWTLSTLAYTWYNSRLVDMSAMNPAMKYMQYIMPVMFVFFFNSSAAGFTCYLFFSNILNIGQTVLIKNFFIDENKIATELALNKAKPKSTTGFRARLEQAMKEQERIKNQNKKK